MSGQGRFCWYELMTTDPKAGKDFYSSLAGWGVHSFEEPMPYTMFLDDEAQVAGLMELPEEARENGAPPHWLAYIKVDDAEATVAAAQAAGGSVYVPVQDIPEMGRFSVLADPQGAVFAIWQTAKEDDTSDDEPAVGRFSWHELMVEDLDAAFDFYSGLFGWVKGPVHDMGEAGIYQIFTRREGTPPIGGMFVKPPELPASWLIYLRVEDADASVAQLRKLGGRVLNGPMEVPGGDMVAQCLDAQGAFFAVHAKAS